MDLEGMEKKLRCHSQYRGNSLEVLKKEKDMTWYRS